MGWTYRMMQRTALKAWWRMTPFERASRVHDGFARFVAGDGLTRAHVRWPGLVAQPGLVREVAGRLVSSREADPGVCWRAGFLVR